MEPKPASLTEVLDRLRDAGCTPEQHARDLADALEILVLLGFDGYMDRRDLDVDITEYRG